MELLELRWFKGEFQGQDETKGVLPLTSVMKNILSYSSPCRMGLAIDCNSRGHITQLIEGG